MLRLAFLTLSAAGATFCSTVRAQELIGIDFDSGNLYSISPKDAAPTLIDSTGLNQNRWYAMAKDSHGRLFAAYGYWNSPFGIYEIDPGTGSATLAMQTNLDALIGLTFAPGDLLYATNNSTGPMNGPDDLYAIDLAAGTVALVGSTGFDGLASLAYRDGFLWSWDTAYSGLVRIDPLTATCVDVNPLIQDNGYNFCASLCFSDDGILYGSFGRLYIVDTLTGSLSYIGTPDTPSLLIMGMEIAPNQPEPFSLGVIGETGGPMGVRSAGATPGGQAAVMLTTGGGSATRVPSGNRCAGTIINLNNSLTLVKLTRADAQGRLILGPVHVPSAPAGLYRLQALDFATCRTSNVARTVF